MAGGSFGPTGVAKERAEQYQGKVTSYVIIACLVAAIGGSIFGYDIGISGGVTSMDEFLDQFFHTVYVKKKQAHESNYCKYDNQGLAAFTSSLYLAGLVSTLAASPITRNYGRRASIVCGGVSFLIGAALNAGAVNLAMLLAGRILLGVGIGFGNQVPLYLSEVAPTHLRGGLNMMFQLATTLGIFTANMTPNSLVERGLTERGRRVLEKLRGTKNVEAELQDMVDASEFANSIKHPFRNILQKQHRPQLVMAICMPMFQILTGINSILFYAPVLFQTMGFGGNASLYSSALTGAVLVLSTLISIALVDRLGRRDLLISGGIQMIICQAIIWRQPRAVQRLIVITIPSEIFPLETRSAGQSITVAVNLLFTFFIAQAFLSMLCAFKFGIFLFFAGWVSVMTIFVYFLLPETKGVPIEEMTLLWKKHWFWKKVLPATNHEAESNNNSSI
ncbi:hypothetical protein N665_0485s0012 [Sinapis alba]|nr:hypothetical protein N665_0485s0012 [Sinapis alba]